MDQHAGHMTGILLAGGKSSRMGKEKGSLKLGNQFLYEYPLQVLEACCENILISSCNPSLPRAPHPLVCDEISGLGPLGGIYSCLKYSSTELNVILSYDMPGINVPLIHYLLTEAKGYDVVVPALIEHQPEPLCGVYRKSALPVFEACIQQKEYAVHKALRKSRSKVLIIHQHMDFWHPELFININTREDLERLSPGFGSATNEH
jgi:molybdopterin-guanine dinucleotide biosynthesis protein A